MLCLLSLVPSISPWEPITQIVPTLFVLSVAIARDGIEDYFRYKSDKKSNRQRIHRVKSDGIIDSSKKECTAGDLIVGQQIVVKEDEEVPADIVILQTSSELGSCYI